ncbi:hypothetical protein B0H63DRAFT_457988 [Podospora didyma]|uniref:Acetoacetate decarboxylase n=1 Tax=Podospora didyma TaxID=330526 RepID=A0AAE0U720_9PEZI|nr:hypothetical protein B0H63DRAFT_457988 [Podospora didyma]
MAASTDTGAIALAPAPWTTKCLVYQIGFWTSSATAQNLPAKAYSPLEAASSYASPEFGKPLGGLSMIQLVRYSETPVGPYDELIFSPGVFEYPLPDNEDASHSSSNKKKTAQARRVTRIYVSSKETCFNGRKVWNIPKHLARFEWTTDPADGSQHVKVFPHDTHVPYDATESTPNSKTPFFQCTIRQPVRFIPSFPFSTRALAKLGINMAVAHPPLPEGKGTRYGELPGTMEWSFLPEIVQYSSRTSLVWIDVSQKDEETGAEPEDGFENFWPGMRRWNLALELKDGGADIPVGERWETPKRLMQDGGYGTIN